MASNSTMLLDALSWDWVVDANGNWAVAGPPYSQAQDAASAIRLFLGELYYDTTQGVPYSRILGQAMNLPLLKASLVAAAKTVPGVVSAVVFLSSIADRTVSGQVQITNSSGQTAAASFGPALLPPIPQPITPSGNGPMNFSVPGNIAITAALP
jgi:hypothetical protein